MLYTVEIERRIRSSRLMKRFLWTLLLLLVYLIGRSLPIVTVPLNTSLLDGVRNRELLETAISVTGGQLGQLSLFTLGLGPWMTTMILWRFLMTFGAFKKLPSSHQQRYRLLMALCLALLQALALTIRLPLVSLMTGGHSLLLARIVTIVVLVAGAFVLIWLGNQNTRLGLGGALLIILTNMVLNLVTTLSQYVQTARFTAGEWLGQMVLSLSVVFALVLVSVVSYRAEYRIPIRRVAFQTHLQDRSYIPIRVNPAGALPFMYGMSLMSLPLFVTAVLLHFFPENTILRYFYQNSGLGTIPGILVYLLVLYLLSIAFAFYNYDTYEIAKNMQRNGDYIEGIRPGKPTQSYVKHYVGFFAQVGGFIILFVSGLPFLVAAGQEKSGIHWMFVLNHLFIVINLLFAVMEQVRSLRSWKAYQEII